MELEDISKFLNLGEYSANIYSCKEAFDDKRLEYYKWQAQNVNADYFYCIYSELENSYTPYLYIYDQRKKTSNSIDLKDINKKIWTGGEIPFAVIVYDFEIKIIDARKHIDIKTGKENILATIPLSDIDLQLKKRILLGLILEERDNDYTKVSPYQILLNHIEANILKKSVFIGCNENLLKRLLVKFILIKYLEEQKDNDNNSVFQSTYFNNFQNPSNKQTLGSFADVLRNGDIITLLHTLNKKFNGGIFSINPEEEANIAQCDFSIVADALDGRITDSGQLSIWRLYEFNLLPIEFISRLYERFVTAGEIKKQQDTGAFYTPPHLARLLVDELLPLDADIDFKSFKILDPSCGSGIFLVLAYKRLITIWMLKQQKQKIQGIEDIQAIKSILASSIYGIDVNEDALSITATSLQIELTSHLQPKEIWDSLTYDNLEKKGNLKNIGFYKWYRLQENQFDLILGNPPFRISDSERQRNMESGSDVDHKAETYQDHLGKNFSFPENNPSLSILYGCLTKCLKHEGKLFLILPATTTLYNSNLSSKRFLKTILRNWDVLKIYDFSPLRSSLWNSAAVATIAISIQNKNIDFPVNSIQHIVIRNTTVNKQGYTRFQVDKYDVFNVSLEDISKKPYIWKGNLLGGGYIHLLIEKYKNSNIYTKIKDLEKIQSQEWIIQDGAKASQKEGTDIALTGLPFLDSRRVKADEISDCHFNFSPTGLYRLDNTKLYHPPNVLIKCNNNQGLPCIVNNDRAFIFDNSFLGIKSTLKNDTDFMSLADTFKKNRNFYRFLITVTSSKTFLQKGGNSLINSGDIKSLPIYLESEQKFISFDQLTSIETAVINDAELMSKSLTNSNGPLYQHVLPTQVDKFCNAFNEVINEVYQEGDSKFRVSRKIIKPDFIWVSFRHSNEPLEKQTELDDTNSTLYHQILNDTQTNSGLSINRVLTYYLEGNTISFIKPNRLKYWTQSIGYRDAENVKADMFLNGY